ncbi:MAG: redoxin domain-containing protein, partial [Planctomycetota bacterium]
MRFRFLRWNWLLGLAWLPAPMPGFAMSPAASADFQSIADLPLQSSDGLSVTLAVPSGVKLHVLCFLGSECPLAKLYGPRLDGMARQYADRQVRFFGVNSNIQDSLDDVLSYVEDHELSFPVVKDHDRKLALSLGATRTPEVFVVDAQGIVRYQGRIDDQYQPGVARPEPTEHDLRRAIDELLSGASVSIPRTESV